MAGQGVTCNYSPQIPGNSPTVFTPPPLMAVRATTRLQVPPLPCCTSLYLALPLYPRAGSTRAWPRWQREQMADPSPHQLWSLFQQLQQVGQHSLGLSLPWHSAPRTSPIPSTDFGEILDRLQTGAVTQKERQLHPAQSSGQGRERML